METGKQKNIIKLPDIQSLYLDVETTAKNNELNILLNQPPRNEWVHINKYANNSNYIKIQTIEYLLTSIFTKWRVEIKSIQVIANSCTVIIRLHYKDPITNEWDWQDGIGASPIQTEKGAAATDFSKVNTSAVQMAAPAAETYAIKDAAEKLGKLFGKDLNRKDVIDIEPALRRKDENLKVVEENIKRLTQKETNHV